jgi:ferredoxin
MACLPVCPVGAFHADDDVADLLTCAAHVEDQPVELLCGLHPHPDTGSSPETIGIQIQGCLAGLGAGALLTLSNLGIKRLTLRAEACADCKWHSLHSEIHSQAGRAARFTSAWKDDSSVECVDEIQSPVERALWNAKNPPLSRRDLFRMMAKQGQIALARAMEKGAVASGRQPGRDRLRMNSALSNRLESSSTVTLDGFGFATLTISEACTACGSCGRACPTSALLFEKNTDEETFSLTFSAKKCIGCGLCDHVCLPDAIALDHEPAFQQVFGEGESQVVASGSLVQCERCKSWVAAREGVKLCPLCEYRRAHPFGSFMPKKIIKGSRR